MAQWNEINSSEEWQEVLKKSSKVPILLFKHSTTCPISATAWGEFQSYLGGNPNEDTEYVMVKVIESRPVSNQIANDLGVVHQSPQAILIQDQKPVWNTSHWNITQDSLQRALTFE